MCSIIPVLFCCATYITSEVPPRWCMIDIAGIYGQLDIVDHKSLGYIPNNI